MSTEPSYKIVKINTESYGPIEELCKKLTAERGSPAQIKAPPAILEAVNYYLEALKTGKA